MSYIVDKFIKKSGSYNYAYVVMITNNDIYANPGIIFSESLRKLGCMSDLVVMVDNKITENTLNLLKNFYNKIILVEEIQINHQNPIQKIILTKINAFKLIEYEKIFLIDVDTIFFSNPDIFFSLDHTRQVNESKTDIIYMPDKKNFGFIMIYPSNEIYAKYVKIMSKYKNEINNTSKPFEFVIKKIFNDTNIKKINFKISYDSYSNVDCIQYRNDKPFLMESEISIEQRQRLEHFKIWFSYLTNILNKNPEIKKYKCVNESIQISKYFLASLSRFIIDTVKLNKNNRDNKILYISNIYGSNNYKNLNYYHLDLCKEYTNRFVSYDIDTYDIKSFLEYIDSLKNDVNLFKKYYEYTNIHILIKQLQNDKKLLNLFLNYYVKVLPNVFCTLEICEKNKLKSQVIPNDIKNNLIYRDTFEINGIKTKNIVFNLCQNFTYAQRFKYINKLLKEDMYILTLSVYELVGIINDYDNNSEHNFFIFYEQNSKIRLSSIFFNPNTINKLFNKSPFDIFDLTNNQLCLKKNISMMYFQTLKKFVYATYSGNELNHIGLIFDDYDKITLIDNNKHSQSKMKNIIKNKIFFVDVIFSMSSQYKHILIEKNINLDDLYDFDKYLEFEGMKIFNILTQ